MKKTMTDLEAIVNKGRLVLGQVFVYYRTVYQNRLMSPPNNKEQLEKARVPHTIIVGPFFKVPYL